MENWIFSQLVYMTDLKQKYINNGIEKVMAEVQKQVDAWKVASGN